MPNSVVTSASRSLYNLREAEVGSTSNSSLAVPSKSVLTLNYIEATARLWHLLSTLQERCCHRHMQDSLPAGWLAFAGRELNPLDHYERFPSCYISFLG